VGITGRHFYWYLNIFANFAIFYIIEAYFTKSSLAANFKEYRK